MVKKEQHVIGWREWVSLPELGIKNIKAKVDTGARSSSLHAYDLKYFRHRGRQFVEFKVYPMQRSTAKVVTSEAEVLEFRNIRSSSGQQSRRPVVLTTIAMLGELWTIELTLANRDEMGFRMLLGRESFRGRMLVDAGKSYYGGKPKKKTKKKLVKKKKKTKKKTL